MERFINILIIDDDRKTQVGLKEILHGSGNNILIANNLEEAIKLIQNKEIGIVLISFDSIKLAGSDILKTIKSHSTTKNIYKIVVSDNSNSGSNLVKGLNEGAVDYLVKPFNPNLVKAKIEVFKTLYFKDQRIGQLLSNIFPENVLEDLSNNGKFSPKRINNGVVLFTDFVNFSAASKNIKPIALLMKLEYYFTQFDSIMEKYRLEKIKTIGDAYMALGGVTENHTNPAIRACLAALEIRNFMINERDLAQAMNRDHWEIRIGIHMGPLVAGIIGTKKFSFDVWGDTVNIAARAEQSADIDSIFVTKTVAKNIEKYFELESKGKIEIKKRGGSVEMFAIESLKSEYCLYNEGKIANAELRQLCQLNMIDFEQMRKFIINKLKIYLADELTYHNLAHALNVEKSALRIASLEGINPDDQQILRTAILYHDSGFITSYENNEQYAIQIARETLPRFGYNDNQINEVCTLIASSSQSNEPNTLLEAVLKDADHDYFGRADYHSVVRKLREEREQFGIKVSDEEWLEYQINYLENQRFYTQTAQNIRLSGKNARLEELKQSILEIKKQ